jgi:LacI family transcriptional regulator
VHLRMKADLLVRESTAPPLRTSSKETIAAQSNAARTERVERKRQAL